MKITYIVGREEDLGDQVHDQDLVLRAGLCDVSHDTLEEGEKHLNELVESASLFIDSVLVGLEDLPQREEPRDQHALVLSRYADSLTDLLHCVLPVLGEINLRHVVDNRA